MGDEMKIGEARTGFEKGVPGGRRFDFGLSTLLAFEAGQEQASALDEKERAALEALKKWRVADIAVLDCLKVPSEERAGAWDAAHTEAVNRRIEAVNTLRAAADHLSESKG